MKDKWKEKVQTSSQIPFCGQTRAFRHEIVFPGIQPYLPSEIYSLLFSPILQHYHISERFQRQLSAVNSCVLHGNLRLC